MILLPVYFVLYGSRGLSFGKCDPTCGCRLSVFGDVLQCAVRPVCHPTNVWVLSTVGPLLGVQKKRHPRRSQVIPVSMLVPTHKFKHLIISTQKKDDLDCSDDKLQGGLASI